jgi:hypothetical protein
VLLVLLALLFLAVALVVRAAAGGSAQSAALPRGAKVVASSGIRPGPGAFAVGEGAVWAISR